MAHFQIRSSYVFIGIIIFAILISANPLLTLAQGLVPCSTIETCDFYALLCLVMNVMGYLLVLIVSLAVLAFMYAGLLYLTSGGSEGQVSRAHGIFVKAGIGLAVAFGAWLLINAIATTLELNVGSFWYLGSSSSGPACSRLNVWP